MKNKTILPLLELLCMIVVFAVSAALCLQGFALASKLSARQIAKDKSVITVQNAAEILKANNGDINTLNTVYHGTTADGVFTAYFDSDFNNTQNSDSAEYTLTISPLNSESQYLGIAHVYVSDDDGILFEINVAWQEVQNNE